MNRYLQFTNSTTGDRAKAIDVTGRSDRHVEQIMRGMLINIGDDWHVADYDADEPHPETVQ